LSKSKSILRLTAALSFTGIGGGGTGSGGGAGGGGGSGSGGGGGGGGGTSFTTGCGHEQQGSMHSQSVVYAVAVATENNIAIRANIAILFINHPFLKFLNNYLSQNTFFEMRGQLIIAIPALYCQAESKRFCLNYLFFLITRS